MQRLYEYNEYRGYESDENPQYHNGTPTKNQFMSQIWPKSDSISTIIRSFKSAVTRQARQMRLQESGTDFAWQDRFHDHIIRDQKEFLRIQKYIINNPASWEEDRFYHCG